MTRDTSTPFTRLVGYDVPIQLAPIGAAGQLRRLSVAVARAGGHAMYPGVLLSVADLPHRVLQRSLDGAARLDEETVGTVPTRDCGRRSLPLYRAETAGRGFEGHVEATAFHAGLSVDRLQAVLPAAEIGAVLAAGVPAGEPVR